jgi:hypothetical protein
MTLSRRLNSIMAAPLIVTVSFGTNILQGAWRAGDRVMAQNELTGVAVAAFGTGPLFAAGASRSGHDRGIVQR